MNTEQTSENIFTQVRCRVIWAYSYSFTFFFMTLIHSESLLYIENGFPKNSLHAALLPLPPPHYTHNHLHVFKAMMHEFLQTSFVSYIYLDIQ